MAACGSLQHIFEKPLPENPTLLESLSQQWKPSTTTQHDQSSSFTEIFGELHFKESSLFPTNDHINHNKTSHNYSFTKNCTEGLGFESSDEVDEILAMNNNNNDGTTTSPKQDCNNDDESRESKTRSFDQYPKRQVRAVGGKAFPPPISCLSKTGKPRVCFESYREDGRFVLKEIRVPTHEFLHACREHGRLKLHFVQPDDEQDDDVQIHNEDHL